MSHSTTEPDATPIPEIAIISLGDMGSGIANLLISHGYTVSTNLAGRSQQTHTRATKIGVKVYPTDEELIASADLVLSIVPPRDAVQVASRVRKALNHADASRKTPLWFLDLNAVSPATARAVGAELGIRGQSLEKTYFGSHASGEALTANGISGEQGLETGRTGVTNTEIILLDGGIIGGPPSEKSPSSDDPDNSSWSKPSIPTSGPYALASYRQHGERLASILNMRHIAKTIGPASGLKLCFASLSKGFAALALQSYSSAQAMGILPELQHELQNMVPEVKVRADKAVTGCPPKAYRWVEEMREIGKCFAEDGQWKNGNAGKHSDGGFADIFTNIAQIYEFMADQTILGQEKIGQRVEGTTPDAVAKILADELKYPATK